MQKVIELKWGIRSSDAGLVWATSTVVIGKEESSPVGTSSVLLAFLLVQLTCLAAYYILRDCNLSWDSIIAAVCQKVADRPPPACKNGQLQGDIDSGQINVTQQEEKECTALSAAPEVCALSGTALRYARVRSITAKFSGQLSISSISDWAVSVSERSYRIKTILSDLSHEQPDSGPTSCTLQFSPLDNETGYPSHNDKSIFNPPLRRRIGTSIPSQTNCSRESCLFSPQLVIGHKDFENHPFLKNCSVSREELEAIVKLRLEQNERRILAPGVGWVSAKRLVAEMAIR